MGGAGWDIPLNQRIKGSITTALGVVIAGVLTTGVGGGKAASATASKSNSGRPQPIVAPVPARPGSHGSGNGPSPAAAERRARGYLVRDRAKFAAAKKIGGKRLFGTATPTTAARPLIP